MTKKKKVRILSEKDYRKSIRDRQRLKTIKPLVEEIHRITSKIK